jgi:hypothetical protein
MKGKNMEDKTADNNNSENESTENRVLGRQGATEISQEDLENVSGGVGTQVSTGISFKHVDINID